MSQTGDDCYFYYYSTCAKGELCPFRHQPAACGCEVTCHLWEKGMCLKKACTFRHMIIEKDRSNIPCLWDNQASGCTKHYCPFLHTKPKNISTSEAPPPHGQLAVNAPPGNTTSTGQSIPILGGNPRTTHFRPMHPQAPPGVGRAGSHMYNSPPRLNLPPNQGPYMSGPRHMQQRPMGYEVGYIPRGQPSHPMMYQMHHNNQLRMAPMASSYTGMIPGMMPNMMLNKHRGDYPRTTSSDYDDSDDDYTSSDFSDVSISDDERKVKARDTSRRRVQSPRHVKNKREVQQRSDKSKRVESRSTTDTHNDRKSSRRRYDEREKERPRKDSREDRNRAKPKKHSEEKESSSEKKRSESPTEKPTEKTKSEPEEQKDDIKVKTLEEILREKALKNLHERTAQKKKAQMEAEKARKEDGKEENNSDSPEPILKSVVSVSKSESTSSQKEPQKSDDDDDDDDDKEVEFIRETKVLLRSPKTIIRSIIDPDNEAPKSSAPASKTIRKIKVKPHETNTENASEIKEEKSEYKLAVDSTAKPNTSALSQIKIKTFEEIMEEKRQRKAQGQQQSSNKDQDVEDTSSESKTQDTSTVDDVKLVKTRKIRVIKKVNEDGSNETKTDPGKVIIVKRKVVQVEPRKGIISKEVPSEVIQEEKTKENKIIIENQKDKPTNIVIKSFDEIIREKRQRQQFQPEPPQPSQESTSTTVKKPNIVRKKAVIPKPVEQKPVAPRTFKSRKLKVVGRQGLSTKGKEVDSEPTSPDSPNIQTIAEPSSHQDTVPSINREFFSNVIQEIFTPADATDDSDDDDDSWEHEELPAVPLDTPTLDGPSEVPTFDGPTEVPDILKPATVFHISGKTTQPNSAVTQGSVSPTKRPRSSLEELFGVRCDESDSKIDKEGISEDEEDKDVSPAKKVKTTQETDDDLFKDINKEMSKTDNFDLELEEEIANLSPDKHYDPHESLNEDDLLLELEEMIND